MPDRRLLVVDDDDAIRAVLCEAFADEGYEVRQAAHGRAALDVLASWTPTAIILDLMMPIMDGWEFREEQRALNVALDVPIVVLSASRQLMGADGLEPAAMVAKPFELDRLIGTIDGLHAS